jgi:hypothetical protein
LILFTGIGTTGKTNIVNRPDTSQATGALIRISSSANLLLPKSIEKKDEKLADFLNGRCRNRTCDPLIKSQLLYQLS